MEKSIRDPQTDKHVITGHHPTFLLVIPGTSFWTSIFTVNLCFWVDCWRTWRKTNAKAAPDLYRKTTLLAARCPQGNTKLKNYAHLEVSKLKPKYGTFAAQGHVDARKAGYISSSRVEENLTPSIALSRYGACTSHPPGWAHFPFAALVEMTDDGPFLLSLLRVEILQSLHKWGASVFE